MRLILLVKLVQLTLNQKYFELDWFPGSSVPESLRPADEAKDSVEATSSDDEEPESDNTWSDNSDSNEEM